MKKQLLPIDRQILKYAPDQLTLRLNDMIKAINDLNRAQAPLAFKARRATTLTSGSSSAIGVVFDYEYYDYGDNYDPATGLFTAPVDGVYHFTLSAFTESTPDTRVFWTSRGDGFVNTISERGLDGDFPKLNRQTASFEGLMKAGTTFGGSLWTGVSSELNHVDTFFAGYLVARMI